MLKCVRSGSDARWLKGCAGTFSLASLRLDDTGYNKIVSVARNDI